MYSSYSSRSTMAQHLHLLGPPKEFSQGARGTPKHYYDRRPNAVHGSVQLNPQGPRTQVFYTRMESEVIYTRAHRLEDISPGTEIVVVEWNPEMWNREPGPPGPQMQPKYATLAQVKENYDVPRAELLGCNVLARFGLESRDSCRAREHEESLSLYAHGKTKKSLRAEAYLRCREYHEGLDPEDLRRLQDPELGRVEHDVLENEFYINTCERRGLYPGYPVDSPERDDLLQCHGVVWHQDRHC